MSRASGDARPIRQLPKPAALPALLSSLLARVHLIPLLVLLVVMSGVVCVAGKAVLGNAHQSVDHTVGNADEDTGPDDAVSEDGDADCY